MKTKAGALVTILMEARRERTSNAGVKRVMRALEILEIEEKVVIMKYLEFARYDTGEPYSAKINRIW